MSGASDKARFYQEQSVPELQELERKKIFTKPEINSIAKRRSEFEHKLNARGSYPSDYARYAEYEMNLEALRRRRVKRMGVKTTNHTGQRRIFFVLDRATRKFHGDTALWMQYVTFARKQKSHKKVSEIMTRALRLHPTNPDLWIYAASYAMDERGDMIEARSYMQRGLRFNEKSINLWIEYARLEMIYISKIVGRRQILGIYQGSVLQKALAAGGGNINGDVRALPATTAEDVHSDSGSKDIVEDAALQTTDVSRALSGAIPLAIFEAAMTQHGGDNKFPFQFFDMVAEFDQLPCQAAILEHVMEILWSTSPHTPGVLIRFIRQTVVGVNLKAADFPVALGKALSRVKTAMKMLDTVPSRTVLGREMMEWLMQYLEEADLDHDIRKVIEMTLVKIWNQYRADVGLHPTEKAAEVSRLFSQLRARGLNQIAEAGGA
ncbi:MAG: hypothetical protein Q9217_004433 [Psora testacea]